MPAVRGGVVCESPVERGKASDYGGRIGHVDIQLWRGQYRIHAIEILKKDAGGAAPFFSARRVDFSIEWRELFHGSVVGQVLMFEPRLNFAGTQTGKNESWDKILESLFPFKLNRMEVANGEVHFQNPHSTPPVDIFLRDVSITATNLSNSRDIKGELPAGVFAQGSTAGGGGVKLSLRLNPVQAAPTYQLTAEVTNASLTALNDFFKAYGKFDVDDGTFAMYASVAAKDGGYDGYAKVFFKRLKVFAWDKERKKDALEIFLAGHRRHHDDGAQKPLQGPIGNQDPHLGFVPGQQGWRMEGHRHTAAQCLRSRIDSGTGRPGHS